MTAAAQVASGTPPPLVTPDRSATETVAGAPEDRQAPSPRSLPLTSTTVSIIGGALGISALALFSAGVLTGVFLSARGAPLAALRELREATPMVASAPQKSGPTRPTAPDTTTATATDLADAEMAALPAEKHGGADTTAPTGLLAAHAAPVEDNSLESLPRNRASGLSHGGYTLQAGVFDTAAQATDRQRTIASLGLPARQSRQTLSDGRVIHVVSVGQYPDPVQATASRQVLDRIGIDATVVPTD
ncbi:SPOR domain-containing protein [Insolitispirillum peregrinum]|uniref:Sporulation related domain-containing protein n=1 Tax=Insolitispirillum peregrinum TaxID=80876 RepID=A0A1N7JGB6_9PROT|nr:SPOR domain-containing protein [Insolitispirillum peregrinum]SIS48395.1 Sporulation related domain-containing protein [Insolitispirillum peregrinum]